MDEGPTLRARTLRRGAALALILLLARPAAAGCIVLPGADARALEPLIERNATQALAEIDTRLASERRAAHAEAERTATLEALEAEAFGILERDVEARAAARAGLALAPAASDPVHLALLATYAQNVYGAAAIDSALTMIATARQGQPPGSATELCLSIVLGRLENFQAHSDLAIPTLLRVYRAARGPDRAAQRVLAAAALSAVLRNVGDFSEALELNGEVVRWYSARNATLALSVARFLRGRIFSAMRRYPEAIREYAAARALSVQVADRLGIAFADEAVCRDLIELGALDGARTRCESALGTFRAAGAVDVVDETLADLARIDLAAGHARRALEKLDAVLVHGGEEMPPRELPAAYELRARINAALRRYRPAYADLDEYVRRYVAANDAERREQAAALRARFETDHELERNAALQRELADARERAAHERAEIRSIAIAGSAGAVIIALLSYSLVTNLRYRRELVRLAEQDSLTGLPNRRRTAELAAAALESARDTQSPLTVALIDLDRFKAINDRAGHAAGDYVLKEFGRAGREALRASDILGRWGGEEFLLVMRDTTLDTALAGVERLRELAARIVLPEACAALRVTLSAGLATSGAGVWTLDDLIARADTALYEAKHEGRDLVRVAAPLARGLKSAARGQ